MSLNGLYDPNNIFARILRNEVPCHKLFEDDMALAFLDAFPQSRGHSLVIPKLAARNLFEMSSNDLAQFMPRVHRVAQGVRKALSPDGIILTQFNGSEAGQTVFHMHVHIIPRFAGDGLAQHASGEADHATLAALAAQIQPHI